MADAAGKGKGKKAPARRSREDMLARARHDSESFVMANQHLFKKPTGKGK